MPKILIVGGGYAGFYTAWRLEKLLRRGEADVTLVDPLPYMTYLPFLPEVAAGLIEPRNVVVSHRRHLRRTKLITGRVTAINASEKQATIALEDGSTFDEGYDQIVVTAGSVSRTFPIPGIADNAIGMKAIEEAVGVRDTMISNFEIASTLAKGDPLRQRLLTVIVVGGGFAGIETFAELRSLADDLLGRFPEVTADEVEFHLIEAMGRIMPEVSEQTADAVLKDLAKRNAHVHLNTQVTSAVDGEVETSDEKVRPSNLIVWTAGVMANPEVVGGSDLPRDERGRIRAQPDLRVVDETGAVVDGAWTAGDISAVPDLSGGGVGGMCVPNAQHAVRQAKRLAKNLAAVLRGDAPVDYEHKNQGAVAGLGPFHGAFQSGKIGFTGPLAWLIHRGYHGMAMPTWERKVRVVSDWWNAFWLRRDAVQLSLAKHPREFFERFASRPKTDDSKPAEATSADEPKDAPSADSTQDTDAAKEPVAAS